MEPKAIRMMYQCQAPAYAARNEIVGKPTDSTPTTPPSVPEIDVEALCKLKREIVSNLPTNCPHCQAEYPRDIKGTFVELRNCGSIVAYCKKPGACGRSNVIFAGVELARPVYEQVCVFRRRVPGEPIENPSSGGVWSFFRSRNSAPVNLAATSPGTAPVDPVATETTTSPATEDPFAGLANAPNEVQQQPSGLEQLSLEDLSQEQQQQFPSDPNADIVAALERLNNPRAMTHDEMMEMHNPTCGKCGLRSLDHKRDVDQNGWRIKGQTPLKTPRGWPVWNPSTGTWS